MVNLTLLVRDRLNLTRQTLDSLAQSGSLAGNTLTILDDRSLNGTRDFLERWSREHGAHLVRNDDPVGTGEARNRVIKASEDKYGRGDFLLLMDNDLCYSNHWLDTMIAIHRTMPPEFLVLGAYNHPFNQPIGRHYLSSRMSIYEVHALSTQSMMMRWSVYDEYGPFCQTPVDRVCQSEDIDFCARIRADEHKVGVASPWLAIGTGTTNTFGQPIPGADLVKSQVPTGILCE